MISGLLAQVLEGTPSRSPMVSMDLHIEILKPIPLQALTIKTQVVREGQHLQVVQGTLLAGETAVALATLLRLRTQSAAPAALDSTLRNTPPGNLTVIQGREPYFEFIDCRTINDDFDRPGPGAAWFRPKGEVIAGQPCSSLAVAMICADAGGGLSTSVSRREWSYPNVSLSLHAHRAPIGEWLKMESETMTSGDGVAQVHSKLSDTAGLFAAAHQALIVRKKAKDATSDRFAERYGVFEEK
jgi:hypothetical protein